MFQNNNRQSSYPTLLLLYNTTCRFDSILAKKNTTFLVVLELAHLPRYPQLRDLQGATIRNHGRATHRIRP